MKLFKNVKFMFDGWLGRYDDAILGSIVAVVLVSLFYENIEPLFLAGACLGLIVIFSIISLCTLNKTNTILATHRGHLYNKVNDNLSDLHTIPKIYDRYATFYSTELLGVIISVITYFAGSDFSFIDSDIAYMIILFSGYLVFCFFTNNKDLTLLYKNAERQA